MAKKAVQDDILKDVVTDEKKPQVNKKEGDLKSETSKAKDKSFVLVFKGAGWCEELQKSYFQGVYTCKDSNEYEILKKYVK
jgi:hypothetical protein